MAFIMIPGFLPGVFICPAATKKLLIFYQNGQSAQNAQTIMIDHKRSSHTPRPRELSGKSPENGRKYVKMP